MAFSKKEEFTTEEIRLAELAKALSHPARISILKLLTATDKCMVGTLVDQMPLAQATVSQHLKELKKAGLLQGAIDGPKICYCIDKKVMAEAKSAIDKLFKNIGCC